MKINWQKTIEQFRGKWGVAGIDLSSYEDLSCCSYMFPYPEDRERVDLLVRTWCPAAKLTDKKNKNKALYQQWADQGWLHITSGDFIDHSFLLKQISEDIKIFDLGLVGVESGWQGLPFVNALEDMLGHSERKPIVIACTNSAKKLGPICIEFERRLLAKKINNGGNPVLRWMADCVAVVEDADGNKRPVKAKSQGKIDGITSSLYALDRLMRSKPKNSIYSGKTKEEMIKRMTGG